jgi:hypothetical protein
MCQVFVIGSGAHASLSDLTIAGGKSNSGQHGSYAGGGINNSGTLELANCTLSGNSAINGNYGGGINNSGTLELANCTLSGNSAISSYGGGIVNSGTAKLANCTLSGNSAAAGGGGTAGGGGIWNTGTLELANCTLSGNSTDGSGGGIANGGTLELANCTLSGNSAAAGGGGIWNLGGYPANGNAIATLVNCTMSGNSAGVGGGIYNFFGTVTLANCTLSGNSAYSTLPGAAAYGGGIFIEGTPAGPSTVILNNSIVANSPEGGDIGQQLTNSGTLRGSHNLVEDGSGLPGWLSGDPGLGELKDNGGPTQTMALLPGSAAIDAGDNTLVPTGVSTDQRGRDRFVNGITDLGAFEFSSQTAPVTTAVSSGQGYADQHGGWNNTDVSITLAATDPGGAGVARTEYTLDGGADWITYAAPFTLSDEGTFIIGYRSVDLGGNVEATHSLTVKIDKTAPCVSAQPTFSPAPTGWYNLATGAPVVHFTATDTGSGVDYNTVPPDQTLAEGANVGTAATIHDVAGNSAIASVSGLKVDLTPPQTRSAPSGKVDPTTGFYLSAVSVSLSAADQVSGVGATYYTVDRGPQHRYTGAFLVAANGIHTINYWSSDNAGNIEPKRSLVVRIDKGTPGSVIGSGSLDRGTRFFNINVQSRVGVVSGHLSFIDRQRQINLSSTSITYLQVQSAPLRATIRGTATVNGVSGFTFTLYVKDNGEPGQSLITDRFRIIISKGGFSYDSADFALMGGLLDTGNIQVHKT